ncbi:MAG: site-2 protease family protein [Chloroflexota bacterium]|nr:site-2 protease family protein [Chloroflexota bacterium]
MNYSDPTYYSPQQAEAIDAQSEQLAQPDQVVRPVEAYPEYMYRDNPAGVDSYDPAFSTAYTGPASVEGYTTDVGAEQRQAAEGSKKRKGLAGLGGIGASIVALAVKFKAFLLLLLNLKWLALAGKFGIAGISALISVFVYSFIFGWQFAVGLVALLFLHEMGHALVMKMKGIPVSGMIFIPMLGAAVSMRQMPANAKDEAEVGIAGPIAGAIASSICLLLALQSPHTPSIWAPLAYFGFFMNLFNLIPIVPFHGGRVLAAIDRRVWILGFLALIGFQIWSWLNGNFSMWLLFIVIIAGTQLWARRVVPGASMPQSYYAVSTRERIALSLLYFGLAAVLYFCMAMSHNMISAWPLYR